MDTDMLTIGEAARRTGLTVKTVRFYSDEGLLEVPRRTAAGYRLYSQGDLVRLDLIRTLREAGLDVRSIRAVLASEMTLSEALALRLRAVEAHVASLQRVGAALRAALRTEPTDADLRRLHAVTRLSNEQRRAVIEDFFRQVSQGAAIDEGWTRDMIEASAPRLPDEPTPEQLDAWVELSEIVSDPEFVRSLRESASRVWTEDFDLQAATAASEAAVLAAGEAMGAGLSPDSPEAGEIVEAFLAGQAEANRREPDESFRREMLDQFGRHDPRGMRYWELVATINAEPEISSRVAEWDWLSRAVVHHLGA